MKYIDFLKFGIEKPEDFYFLRDCGILKDQLV